MAIINPYLSFNGNCEEAFNFYKAIFGGDFSYLGRFSEMPADENYPISESEKNKIMHICLPISKETALMGADSSDSYGAVNQGNNITISISPDSEEEAYRLFNSLSEGGVITMPIQQTFWNAIFGMLTDKYGINWMVNYELSQN